MICRLHGTCRLPRYDRHASPAYPSSGKHPSQRAKKCGTPCTRESPCCRVTVCRSRRLSGGADRSLAASRTDGRASSGGTRCILGLRRPRYWWFTKRYTSVPTAVTIAAHAVIVGALHRPSSAPTRVRNSAIAATCLSPCTRKERSSSATSSCKPAGAGVLGTTATLYHEMWANSRTPTTARGRR